jgi:hypothetical protein
VKILIYSPYERGLEGGGKMKRQACMLAAAILFWGLGFAADLHADTVILNPTADTWVSRLAPEASHGSDTGITSSIIESNVPMAYALLKFDVSSILSGQTIQSAVLHLYQFGGTGSDDYPSALIYWADNNWDESTLKWSNMTLAAEKFLVQSWDGQSHRGDSTWSFSWDSSWGNIITLLLAEYSSNSVQSHNWYSKEYSDTDLRPYLVITTTTSISGDFTAPGDCDVDGSDLAALIANMSLMDFVTFAEHFGKNACQ